MNSGTSDKQKETHDNVSEIRSIIANDPLNFEKLITPHASPSCKPISNDFWDAWVGKRYAKYGGRCISPELMKETGESFAISGLGSSLDATKEVQDY